MKYRICEKWKRGKQPRSVTAEDKLHLLLPFLAHPPSASLPFSLRLPGGKKELWAPLIFPTFLTAFRELVVAPDRFRVASVLSRKEEEDSRLLFPRYVSILFPEVRLL